MNVIGFGFHCLWRCQIYERNLLYKEVLSRNKFSTPYERDVVENSIIKGIASVMLVEMYSTVLKIKVFFQMY